MRSSGLTWITFGLDFVIRGMKPAGYHLTSLVIFAANVSVSVFYFVALRLLRRAAGFAGGGGRGHALFRRPPAARRVPQLGD